MGSNPIARFTDSLPKEERPAPPRQEDVLKKAGAGEMSEAHRRAKGNWPLPGTRAAPGKQLMSRLPVPF